MIKKLRKRVIALTMAAVLLVLLILMSIVNIFNYVSTDRNISRLLNLLDENGGTFKMFEKDDWDGGHPQGPMDQGDGWNGNEPQDILHGKGKKDDLSPGMTKETPYETRFFSVSLDDKTRSLITVDTSRIAAVDSQQATELAQEAASSKSKSAYIRYENFLYKYKAVPQDNGSTLYIFVDATRSMDSVTDFLLISLLVSLCGLMAIGALVIALSPMMIKPIAESYEKQKTFITNAGHELKTPLAVIKSCNEVSELESGGSKWTRAISEQVDKMTELTGKLVALSKMDEAAELLSDFPMEKLNLSDLLVSKLETFYLLAQQKGLNLTCKIGGENIDLGAVASADSAAGSINTLDAGMGAGVNADSPTSNSYPAIEVNGNRAALEELISILADNAIKYTSSNGDIVFSLNKSGNKVVLTEENPSTGLSKGKQAAFFDRFYRGDQSHSGKGANSGEKIEGYGIGLSMAQAVVTAHGGSITADSPDGERLIITTTI